MSCPGADLAAEASRPLRGWRQLRPDDRDGFVVVMRPVDGAGVGRFWCGPVDPDSSVTWLRHRDPVKGVVVSARMAVFVSAWDATVAWAWYLALRRRRGTPVREFAHFFPLKRLTDWSRVPPLPERSARRLPPCRVSTLDRLELSVV